MGAFLSKDILLHLWYKTLLILGEGLSTPSPWLCGQGITICLGHRATSKLKNHVPPVREWHWDHSGSPGTDMGTMGIMWVLWFSRGTASTVCQAWVCSAVPGLPDSLSPNAFAEQINNPFNAQFSSSLGLSRQLNWCPCVFFPLYYQKPSSKLCLTHLCALDGALHTGGICQRQAEGNWIKPSQLIQSQRPPYLVERDDPVGLIGRFPLDVDLLLKGTPLDGL